MAMGQVPREEFTYHDKIKRYSKSLSNQNSVFTNRVSVKCIDHQKQKGANKILISYWDPICRWGLPRFSGKKDEWKINSQATQMLRKAFSLSFIFISTAVLEMQLFHICLCGSTKQHSCFVIKTRNNNSDQMVVILCTRFYNIAHFNLYINPIYIIRTILLKYQAIRTQNSKL